MTQIDQTDVVLVTASRYPTLLDGTSLREDFYGRVVPVVGSNPPLTGVTLVEVLGYPMEFQFQPLAEIAKVEPIGRVYIVSAAVCSMQPTSEEGNPYANYHLTNQSFAGAGIPSYPNA